MVIGIKTTKKSLNKTTQIDKKKFSGNEGR